MDIERLKELQIAKQVLLLNKSVLEYELAQSKDDQDFIDAVEIAVALIDAEIARQSVKSEDNWKELREEFMHNLRGCDTVTVSLSGIGSTDYSTEDIHNMISALTDNQPVAKLATSEEVQEAIEYFEDTMQFISGEPQEKDHRLAITALQEYQPKGE